jgi:phosphatidate cytidylyltransferase
MLRSRLILGTSLIAVLVALSWLDHRAAVPGVWLAPALVALVVLATRELLGMCEASGLKPIAPVVYAGNVLVLLSPWVPIACQAAGAACPPQRASALAFEGSCLDASAWTLAAFVAVVILALVGEMVRYEKPGRVTADLAAAVFSVAYLGLLLSFVVRLRLTWGIGSLASLVIVVKMGDTGAYFFGKALGRHRMSPVLSPHKTVEGAFGALLFSCLASWAVFRWLVPATTPDSVRAVGLIGPIWGAIVFGLLIGGVGIVGDLAESLLKRDAARKESSTRMPGLGGVLDMLDSVILASPVAYACWHLLLIG